MRIKNQDHSCAMRLYNNAGPHSALQFLLGKQPEYRAAEPHLRSAYCAIVGKFYSMLGNYPKADEYFDLSIAAAPHNLRAHLEMADSYMRRGDLLSAGKTLLELTERPILPEFEFELVKLTGRYFKLEGDYEQAKQVYASHPEFLTKTSVIEKDDQFIDKLLGMWTRPTYRIEGALDYAFHLRRHEIEGASAADISANFLGNRLKHTTDPWHKAAIYEALAEIHLKENQYCLAKKYNNAALDIDQTNPKTLATKLSLLLLTRDATPNEVRSEFAAERVFIMKDAKAACALARVFHLAGMDDLTRTITTKLLCDAYLPTKVRKSATILLHSNPVPPERRIDLAPAA